MGIDDDRPATGGTWVDLKEIGDKVKGEFLSESERQKTFEGQVVTKRGTNTPRIEHVLRLQATPANADDDGIRLVTADEAAWNAVLQARDELKGEAPGWTPSQAGSVVALQVTAKEPAGAGYQRTYAAKWWKPTGTIDNAASAVTTGAAPSWDDEEPFISDVADWLPGVWGSYPDRML